MSMFTLSSWTTWISSLGKQENFCRIPYTTVRYALYIFIILISFDLRQTQTQIQIQILKTVEM